MGSVNTTPHKTRFRDVKYATRTSTSFWYCKDNTSQDRFRRVNLYKEFTYKSEIE